MAVLAVLALALLTGVLALRSHPADAATPIHQNSQGQSATFEQNGLSADGCTATQVTVSVTSSKSVATAAGGPANVTNETLLHAYINQSNSCTQQFREADWDVALAPNQFRMDNALNKAVLSATLPTSWADVCDFDWNCQNDNGGTGTFNVTWQRTGNQLVSPSHGSSHTQGQDLVNLTFSGQGYAANANGSIVLNGAGASTITVNSTNDANNSQDAYLSNTMTVSVIVVRPPRPIVIPAGHTLTLHNTVLSGCDPLTWGYQLDGGANVTVGSRIWHCATYTNADTTIGPVDHDTTIRIWATDSIASPSLFNCAGYPASYTYYSDGAHALVTGDSPYQVDIMDGGYGCSYPADQPLLPSWPGQGNLSLTLIVSP